MKKLNLKNWKNTFGSMIMACVLMLGVWCMAGCDKDDDNLSGKSGMISYDGSTYSLVVEEIGKNTQGYTYVKLSGTPMLLDIQNGKISPIFGVKITAGGSTFEMKDFSPSTESTTYYFSTRKNPEQIIVYSTRTGKTLLTL
jgi:hypothetical protein